MLSGYYRAFTPDVKSVLNENLGGILGGVAPIVKWGHRLMLSEC
jgi:hypothetical protein